MARRRKQSPVKKVVVIGLVLIVIQGVYLVIFGSQSKPIDIREAITKAVDQKTDLSVERREKAKIQLAITDYLAQNGRPPASLDELVPTYFDVLPVDPGTNQAFKYRVDGMKFYVGEESSTAKTLVSSKDTTEPGTTEERLAVLEALNASAATNSFVYDPTGKRDPFMPFDLAPVKPGDENKTPLERYNLGELKLTAVLKGFSDPSAIVENSAGKGFTVKIGTKIGPNGAEIIDILPDKLLILETEVDFTGNKKSRTIEMRLRTKDMER